MLSFTLFNQMNGLLQLTQDDMQSMTVPALMSMILLVLFPGDIAMFSGSGSG